MFDPFELRGEFFEACWQSTRRSWSGRPRIHARTAGAGCIAATTLASRGAACRRPRGEGPLGVGDRDPRLYVGTAHEPHVLGSLRGSMAIICLTRPSPPPGSDRSTALPGRRRARPRSAAWVAHARRVVLGLRAQATRLQGGGPAWRSRLPGDPADVPRGAVYFPASGFPLCNGCPGSEVGGASTVAPFSSWQFSKRSAPILKRDVPATKSHVTT